MAFDWATIGQAALSGGLNAIGSYLSANAAEDASKKAYKRAKEFAQSGIQWKVSDANAAGINPYFALGAPTATYTDAGIGVDPLGSALSSMGQDVSRAALANTPPETKLQAQMGALSLERAGLENDYLRAKIASELRLNTQPGTPPGLVGFNTGRKGDRLSSGGSAVIRDADGQVWTVPIGADAQTVENIAGEQAGDTWGWYNAANAFLNKLGQRGVWPGVLGY